jgi:hypothetical protein
MADIVHEGSMKIVKEGLGYLRLRRGKQKLGNRDCPDGHGRNPQIQRHL